MVFATPYCAGTPKALPPAKYDEYLSSNGDLRGHSFPATTGDPMVRDIRLRVQLSHQLHCPFDRTNSRGRHPPSGRDRAYPPPHLPALHCNAIPTPPPPHADRSRRPPPAVRTTTHQRDFSRPTPMSASTPAPHSPSRQPRAKHRTRDSAASLPARSPQRGQSPISFCS